MAYNRRNILQRIIDIQNITLEHKANGATQEWIFMNKIFPVYKISKNTYYRYLATNAKRELKKIQEAAEADKNQLTIF